VATYFSAQNLRLSLARWHYFQNSLYKGNALEGELREVRSAEKLLTKFYESLQSEPGSCEGADGRNPEQERLKSLKVLGKFQG
jgi:hypothetical protein